MAKQAKWSPIWDDETLTRAQKVVLVKAAAFTAPSTAVSKVGGGYPSRQPAKFRRV